MQIALFPYTSTGTAVGPRSERQEERALSEAPLGASEDSSSTGPVDLIAAVGATTAPLSVLVEAASLLPPVEMAGEAAGGSAADSQAEPLTPLGSGEGDPDDAAEEPLVLPGAGDRAREPIAVELPGSRPAAEGQQVEPGRAGAATAEALRPAIDSDSTRRGAPSPVADPAASAEAGDGPGVTEELSEDEKQQVEELKQRDREVRRHEQAHVAAGGQYVRGGASFEYTTGPDNKRYAVGGEVSIDTSEVADDPEATIRKAQVVYRAALAPAEPSGQDRSVASAAKRMEGEARRDLAEERREEMSEAMDAARGDGEGEGTAAETETGESAAAASEPAASAPVTSEPAASAPASGANQTEPGAASSPASPGPMSPRVAAEPEIDAAIPPPVAITASDNRGANANSAISPEPPHVDASIDASPRYSVGRLLDVMA